ncbi:MAG: dTDP-glucose 4,6-dehydratase [Candidatus Omnitrophica bacterium]|nr:dTDP-glucose 4,6-dehydratase [Candidatus Omnitrophota bacterium]
MHKTIIVTGGAGFIGSNFVRHLVDKTKLEKIVILDKLTYAGNLGNLEGILDPARVIFEKNDIADAKAVERIYQKHRPDWIVNFAAESHVDRSIDNPSDFIETNIVGTSILLDKALKYYGESDAEHKKTFRFLHVSTDEVYGTLGAEGLFKEETPYAPNSPYAASKAAADHLVRAYYETYGLPALITNCSNNYGPYQFPEKLIPLALLNAIEGKSIPIYGDGLNVRDWLYVEDHCEGILLALQKGRPGEKYNIGGSNEKTNMEVINTLLGFIEEFSPAAANTALSSKGIKSYEALKTFVKDRPGHDRRYAIDAQKIKTELGWQPQHNFQTGLRATVQWYLSHLDWCREVQSGKYQRERLGLAQASD